MMANRNVGRSSLCRYSTVSLLYSFDEFFFDSHVKNMYIDSTNHIPRSVTFLSSTLLYWLKYAFNVYNWIMYYTYSSFLTGHPKAYRYRKKILLNSLVQCCKEKYLNTRISLCLCQDTRYCPHYDHYGPDFYLI